MLRMYAYLWLRVYAFLPTIPGTGVDLTVTHRHILACGHRASSIPLKDWSGRSQSRLVTGEYRKHLRPTTAGLVQSIAWGKNFPRVELEKSKKTIVLTRKTGTYTGLYLLIMIDDDVEGA